MRHGSIIRFATLSALVGAACAPRPPSEPLAARQSALAALPTLQQVGAIGVGGGHSCAVVESGRVVCWGSGDHGALGDMSLAESYQAIPIAGIEDATALALSWGQTCALRATGNVVCWGRGDSGQLGDGSTSDSPVPVTVSGLANAVAIAAGRFHTCAVQSTGRIACWGQGLDGQLGNGDTANSPVPINVSGITNAIAVAGGDFYTCAILATGEVNCWGRGDNGRLGRGSNADSPVPVTVNGLSDAVAVAASGHTCAVRAGGGVMCWGFGGFGALGNGGFSDSTVPVAASGIANAVSIVAGAGHTCALRETGAVACWGQGSLAQLGTGSYEGSPTPVNVTGIPDATAISAGGAWHTCAQRASGRVSCWGSGSLGRLGNGGFTRSDVPATVPGLSDAVAVTAHGTHVCALRATGSVSCWGDGSDGQLGNGRIDTVVVPGPVSGLTDALSVSGGQFHNCALRSTGRVVCWGMGDSGQLGNGASGNTTSPVTVSGLTDAIAVGAGREHTCALRATGTAVCWGSGPGSAGDSNVPVAVPSLTSAVSLSAGERHTCAVRSTGQVHCWGDGSLGQLGNGGTASSGTPVIVAGLTDALEVAAGRFHNCARRATGQVVCWGLGDVGQLGNGTEGPDAGSSEPVTVVGISDAVAITSGLGHSCAVRANGQVVCWGWAEEGRLGDGSNLGYSSVPVTAVGLFDATSVAGGILHTCAVRANGLVSCWGRLVVPSQLQTSVPVTVAAAFPQGCIAAADCLSGFCVDGVCCAEACGGGNTNDCQACSIAAGGTADGMCTLLAASTACGDDGNACTVDRCDGTHVACQHPAGNGGVECRGVGGPCDVAESCDGSNPACPADVFTSGGVCGTSSGPCEVAATCNASSAACPPNGVAAIGTPCHTAADFCEGDQVCTGSSTVCPSPALPPEMCTAATNDPFACGGEPACIELRGGTEEEGGLEITFFEPYAGEIRVEASGEGCPPSTGFEILSMGESHGEGTYLDISADPPSGLPQMKLCINYPQGAMPEAGVQEQGLRIAHGTTLGCVGPGDWDTLVEAEPINMVDNIICAFTDSLSPFAIFVPSDVAPEMSPLPGTIVAYATSTAGATVSYTLPTAVDSIDGSLPVVCAPAPGATFPPGKTTVTCSASDTTGHTTTATFVVWVQYQAPTDGTFFLRPIRPDNSAVFRIGRPVPVRFRLTGASKNITDLVAKLVVTKISNNVTGTAEDVSDETVDDTDFTFKYRALPLLKWYAYRWKTRDQTKGTYQLRAELGDGVLHQINVSLRAPQ